MQELVINESQLMQFIGQYIWPMLRIGAFFFAVPVIGARTVPARTRIILTLFTVMLVAPLLPPPPDIAFLSVAAVVPIIQEVTIGLAMGFMMQIVLHVFVLAGQFIAMKMGLGFAAMNDPSSGVSVTVLSQFYLLLSTLLFLAVNGHVVLIDAMVISFDTMPIGGSGLSLEQLWLIVNMGSWMFACGLVISLPLFTSLLVVNMAFGAMNRSAPQMNVFTVGFPITLIFGLFLMWAGLAALLPNFDLFIYEGIFLIRELIGAP